MKDRRGTGAQEVSHEMDIAQTTDDGFRLMRRALEESTDPRRRQMIEVHLAHMVAELLTLDIDALMATMVPEPEFDHYGLGGAGNTRHGYEPVRTQYLRNFEKGPGQAGMQLERYTVGDNAIVNEGLVLMSEDFAFEMFPSLAAHAAPDRTVMVRKRACIVFPFVDGLIAGETSYFDGPFTLDDVIEL